MANMAFFCRIISRCWFQQHLKYMYQNKTKWVHLPQICAKVQKSLKQPPKDSEHVQVLNDFFLRSLCTSDIIISKMFKSNKVATTSKHLSCNLIPQVNLVSELGKTRHQGSTLPGATLHCFQHRFRVRWIRVQWNRQVRWGVHTHHVDGHGCHRHAVAYTCVVPHPVKCGKMTWQIVLRRWKCFQLTK